MLTREVTKEANVCNESQEKNAKIYLLGDTSTHWLQVTPENHSLGSDHGQIPKLPSDFVGSGHKRETFKFIMMPLS